MGRVRFEGLFVQQGLVAFIERQRSDVQLQCFEQPGIRVQQAAELHRVFRLAEHLVRLFDVVQNVFRCAETDMAHALQDVVVPGSKDAVVAVQDQADAFLRGMEQVLVFVRTGNGIKRGNGLPPAGGNAVHHGGILHGLGIYQATGGFAKHGIQVSFGRFMEGKFPRHHEAFGRVPNHVHLAEDLAIQAGLLQQLCQQVREGRGGSGRELEEVEAAHLIAFARLRPQCHVCGADLRIQAAAGQHFALNRYCYMHHRLLLAAMLLLFAEVGGGAPRCKIPFLCAHAGR